jgi:hypothetical protein
MLNHLWQQLNESALRLAVIGPLFEQALSLLDNAAHRDTPQWQTAAGVLKAQLKEAVANDGSERSGET